MATLTKRRFRITRLEERIAPTTCSCGCDDGCKQDSCHGNPHDCGEKGNPHDCGEKGNPHDCKPSCHSCCPPPCCK